LEDIAGIIFTFFVISAGEPSAPGLASGLPWRDELAATTQYFCRRFHCIPLRAALRTRARHLFVFTSYFNDWMELLQEK
jgi:hypothetical protein